MTDTKHETLTAPFKTVIRGICCEKEEIRFELENAGNTVVFQVYPHMTDLPKLIGKAGRQANAIKFLFVCAATNLGYSSLSVLDLKESFVGTRQESVFQSDPNFDKDELAKHVKSMAEITMGCPVDVTHRTQTDGVLKLFIKPEQFNKNSSTIIAAIDAVFHPYAVAHGRKKVEFRLAREE